LVTEEENVWEHAKKLNSHHIAGAIGVAGIIGLLTGSWLVAAVVGALAVGMAIHTGDIRLKGRD
jgi:Kef-type K+ transport system membrane component KefB